MDLDPVKNPEFFLPESTTPIVIGVAAFLMVSATTAVTLRFYTRKIILNRLGVDDWLSLGALVCAIIPGQSRMEELTVVKFFTLWTGISQCFLTRNGLGRHVGTLEQPDGMKKYLKSLYFVLIWYNIAMGLVKMTFLTQYYRVFPTPKVRKLCIVAMVVIGCWSLMQLLLTILLCVPIAGFWDRSVEATCIPLSPEWYQNAVGNVITDIAIFCLPLPVLSHLKLPRTQKWVLIGIFSLGFFTCAISIIRIQFLGPAIDITWTDVAPSAWSLCEVCSGIICTCLPCLRPLAVRWYPVLAAMHCKRGSKRPTVSYSRSQPLTDLETVNRNPYSRLNAGSGDGEDDGFHNINHTTFLKLETDPRHDLQEPKPIQLQPYQGGIEPIEAPWIRPSSFVNDVREDHRRLGSVIHVRHDIVVHKSQLPT